MSHGNVAFDFENVVSAIFRKDTCPREVFLRATALRCAISISGFIAHSIGSDAVPIHALIDYHLSVIFRELFQLARVVPFIC